MRPIIALTVVIIWSCGPSLPCKEKRDQLPVCSGRCEAYFNDGQNITDYPVDINTYTPGGIAVDATDTAVDLDKLDDLTSELEACLGLTINRQCFAVKIAPDWYISECTGTELFPCDFSQARCDAFRPEGSLCPCNCAGVIQDGNFIIVPPGLAAYKHELLHVSLGLSDDEIALRQDLNGCASGNMAARQ